MTDFYLPLSGGNYQSIDPFSLFFKATGTQLGFININTGRSSDPELEQRIIREVGTYGKQLGAMGDVLRILIKHVNLDDLQPAEKQAVDALKCQLDEIDKMKRRRYGQALAPLP